MEDLNIRIDDSNKRIIDLSPISKYRAPHANRSTSPRKHHPKVLVNAWSHWRTGNRGKTINRRLFA